MEENKFWYLIISEVLHNETLECDVGYCLVVKVGNLKNVKRIG